MSICAKLRQAQNLHRHCVRHSLRCLIVILALAAAAMPARACLGASLEETIFFDKVPPDFFPGPDFHADVVADVVLEDVQDDGRHGVIHARVKYASKGAVKAGELIQLHYDVSSCGPYHQKGEDGMIAARYGDAQDGQKILIAHTRPRGD